MKKFIILLSGIFLFGCSGNDPEAIQKRIITYKDKINSYNEKIVALEEILASDTSLKQDDRATVIRVKEMVPQTFKHFIQVSGKVIAEEEAFISPEINGQISGVLVQEGQRVKSGQLLLTLNTDVTEKSIQEVKSSLELLTNLYEKQKSLWDQNIGTEVQYLQAKTNKESTEARLSTLEEQMKMAQITAPFSGIVEDILVQEGEMAMPGARLIHLVNLKDLSIEADVSESYLNDIRVGEIVEVDFPTYPGINKMLPIERVGSVIDNLSRTFQLELELKNPDERIKPNQLATLKINDFISENAMVVPTLIIKQDISGSYLYIAENRDGIMKSTKKYVTPGRSADEFTMINEGLKPGTLVILEGFNLVKDGTEVRILSQ